MTNYHCGNTPKVGDVVERVGATVDNVLIGNHYIVTSLHLNTVNLEGHGALHYHQECFKLIKRKEDTMTNPNQHLLDYAVENIKEWDKFYPCLRSDSSSKPLFFTSEKGWDIGIFWKDQWVNGGEYEYIVGTLGKTSPQVITKDEWLAEIKRREEEKDMNKPLERDQEYDVKLTGEDIAKLYLITGSAYGMHKAYATFSALLGADGEAMYVELPSIKLNAATGYEVAMKKLLPSPETEKQRHLREIKEQYEALGEKIKQMEK